jgi:hypothetical protein
MFWVGTSKAYSLPKTANREALRKVIDLDGPDGNAFAVIGLVARLMIDDGATNAELSEMKREAFSAASCA